MIGDRQHGLAMDPDEYPTAARGGVVETLHGHRVADPYRWLEDPTAPDTVRWSSAQDELARTRLDALPGRDVWATRVRGLLAAGWAGVPVWRSGRAFATRREPHGEHPVLTVREPDGTERVLLDVAALDPAGLTTLDSWSPSPDGTRLAYQISVGGDEESLLHVLDVATGEVLDGPIDRCRHSSVAWAPDATELYYVRRLAADLVPADEAMFHRRVWRHVVGTDPELDELVHGDGEDPTNYYGVSCSPDGRWLLVSASAGTAPRTALWVYDRTGVEPARQALSYADETRAGAWVARDGLLYVLTTRDAPRWRLCVTEPSRPEPEHWRELIGEDPGSVLGGVRWLEPVDGGEPLFAALRTRHAVAEIHLHSVADGTARGVVPLPGPGSITGVTSADEHTPEQAGRLWIGWTDPRTPPGVLRHDLASGATSTETTAPGAVDLPPARTVQTEFASADGTVIRMFVTSPTGAPDRPRPTVVTGYGGFSISREPEYSAAALSWVAAGGVWAVVSLRGGGEEGERWHRAGMRENKHAVFEDFHAAAEALVADDWATPDGIGIEGGSNGGLLVGAALTQRPAAYRAVVCSAPLLDMVRYERFLLGRTWNDEYGSADDPTELGWLLGYSPYHAVTPGTEYPAVLFTVFESDTRVDPLHARKMAAALQYATTGSLTERPVLLRREIDAGHSTRSVSRSVALLVDRLAFLAHHCGLDGPGVTA